VYLSAMVASGLSRVIDRMFLHVGPQCISHLNISRLLACVKIGNAVTMMSEVEWREDIWGSAMPVRPGRKCYQRRLDSRLKHCNLHSIQVTVRLSALGAVCEY
jgi:hypothetical protein